MWLWLNVEVKLNNRPLTYIVEYLENLVLTPNSTILERYIKLPDDSPKEEEITCNWKKRQRYNHECKEAAWKRWFLDYLIVLKEKHNLSHKEKQVKTNVIDVVMIKGDEKNRQNWEIKIIENIFMGKDNTNISIRICTRETIIERPIHLLYPLRLYYDLKTTTSNTQEGKRLSDNAKEFRPKSSVTTVAKQRIRDITEDKNQ